MGKANRGAPMNNQYTAVIKKDGNWWIQGDFDLLRPIYRQTINYGHFDRSGLPWEKPGRNKDSL
jgi:S-adenosylmethionine synthetase